MISHADTEKIYILYLIIFIRFDLFLRLTHVWQVVFAQQKKRGRHNSSRK